MTKVRLRPKRIRLAMLQQDVSVGDIVELLGLSHPSVWRRLAGRVLWRKAEAEMVAKRLGTSVEWLEGRP